MERRRARAATDGKQVRKSKDESREAFISATIRLLSRVRPIDVLEKVTNTAEIAVEAGYSGRSALRHAFGAEPKDKLVSATIEQLMTVDRSVGLLDEVISSLSSRLSTDGRDGPMTLNWEYEVHRAAKEFVGKLSSQDSAQTSTQGRHLFERSRVRIMLWLLSPNLQPDDRAKLVAARSAAMARRVASFDYVLGQLGLTAEPDTSVLVEAIVTMFDGLILNDLITRGELQNLVPDVVVAVVSSLTTESSVDRSDSVAGRRRPHPGG